MWSSSVTVHPWVGTRFACPVHFRHKTLILGESNFTTPEKFGHSLVQNCVHDDLSSDMANKDTTGFCRFSTKIRRIIFGRHEAIEPEHFWQDVAFYNFVQFLVGDQARVRPTFQMWEQSVPAFVEIIDRLEPSRILVLGKANWQNLLTHIEHQVVDQHSAHLRVRTQQIFAGYVNHPSFSLSYEAWNPVARKILFSA